MRKWVVIGVLLIGVASVLGFLLTRPKEGSVEWHKREYRRAFDRLQGKSWVEQGRRLLQRVIGAQPSRLAAQQRDWYMKLKEHRSALLETGYFVQRTFVITNADARKISKTIALGWRDLIPKENIRYTWMENIRADVVTIVGRPEDMPKWEEAVRKLDVPDPK